MLPRLLTLVLVSLLGLACATDTGQRWPLPDQSVELSDPSLCRIYVARSAQARGAFRKLTVIEAGDEIGSMGAGEYLCWERLPGRLVYSLRYDGGVLDGVSESVVDLQAEAGAVYYFAISVEAGSGDAADANYNKPHPVRLSREEGRALIADREPARQR